MLLLEGPSHRSNGMPIHLLVGESVDENCGGTLGCLQDQVGRIPSEKEICVTIRAGQIGSETVESLNKSGSVGPIGSETDVDHPK